MNFRFKNVQSLRRKNETTQTLAFMADSAEGSLTIGGGRSQLCDLESKALKYTVYAQSVQLIPRSSSETTSLSLKLAGGTAA